MTVAMKRVRRVYIVFAGERYEGGSVHGVFNDIEHARECAVATSCSFPGGWKKKNQEDYWTNGCDFVQVETHDVR